MQEAIFVCCGSCIPFAYFEKLHTIGSFRNQRIADHNLHTDGPSLNIVLAMHCIASLAISKWSRVWNIQKETSTFSFKLKDISNWEVNIRNFAKRKNCNYCVYGNRSRLVLTMQRSSIWAIIMWRWDPILFCNSKF